MGFVLAEEVQFNVPVNNILVKRLPPNFGTHTRPQAEHTHGLQCAMAALLQDTRQTQAGQAFIQALMGIFGTAQLLREIMIFCQFYK